MTFSWGPWGKGIWQSDSNTPYVDWWRYLNEGDKGRKAGLTLISGKLTTSANSAYDPSDFPTALAEEMAASYGAGSSLPLPDFARNADFDGTAPWLLPANELPAPPAKDAVIVGVIDSGIALGHRRFRHADGTTRVLAAWQQNAQWNSTQPHLPFGRELLSSGIDTLIAEHGTADGWLDEEAFNRAAGLADMFHARGHRALERTVAHGTHVLDQAAGYDPKTTDAALLNDMPILAVNLPNRSIVGLSGSFLEYFVLYGLYRIASLSDALWNKAGHAAGDTGTNGYPIVINLSFGKQAGPKDGYMMFERHIQALNKFRKKAGWSKIHVVLPAGNDNLMQGNAKMALAANEAKTLRWRVLPEDQSSNYVTIWSGLYKGPGDKSGKLPLEISITPPGQRAESFTAGKHGEMRQLGSVARLYCLVEDRVYKIPKKKRAKNGPKTKIGHRIQYLICAAPTLGHEVGAPIAPAGVWEISVKNAGKSKTKAYLNVQTDQSPTPGGSIGLRAYFDAPDYVTHDPSGRSRDSYAYPARKRNDNLDTAKQVRRHGTLNAIASFRDAIVIGGYRKSDGRPAPYSSTGKGKVNNMGGRARPTVSLPTDDSPLQFGVMAAGSRDGTTAAMQGTSFASAQASRMVAQYLRKKGNGHKVDPGKALRRKARKLERMGDMYPQRPVKKNKVGTGRLPAPELGRLGRSS